MEKKISYLILLIILLASAATFFRDTKILFSAFALSTIIILDYTALLNKGKKFTDGINIRRIFDRSYLLRGGEVSATCTLSPSYQPEKATVEIREIAPDGTSLSGGTNLYTKDNGIYRAEYSAICNAHGILSTRGIRLTVSDSLFKISMELPIGEMPGLHVFPRPEFAKTKESSIYGDDTDMVTPIRGSNIRDYREYSTSDDPRHIDWKMSAKHRKLYVREYTFIEGISETLIVDLPDQEMQPFPEDMEKLKGIAGNLIIDEKDNKGEIRLVRVSGPNLIKVERVQKISEEISSLIGNLAPVRRTTHMYRYKRYVSSAHKGRNTLSSNLERLKDTFNPIKLHHIFENQIAGILHYQKSTEIAVVTLGRGDLSHLRIISDAAKKYRMRSVCYIPRQEGMDAIVRRISECGFNRLEVV